MKKLLLILVVFCLSRAVSFGQSADSIFVDWSGTGPTCYCPTTVVLEVCWCTWDTVAQSCSAGTDTCAYDTTTTLFPNNSSAFQKLQVNVPAGKTTTSRKLYISPSCTNPAIFDLDSPNGVYTYPGVVIGPTPPCTALQISKSGRFITISTGP